MIKVHVAAATLQRFHRQRFSRRLLQNSDLQLAARLKPDAWGFMEFRLELLSAACA